MYWWVPVSIAAVVIAAMFGYAYGRTTDDLEPLAESPSPTLGNSPLSNPTGIPAPADFYLFHCMPKNAPSPSDEQMTTIVECLDRQGIEASGVFTNGTIPIAIFQLFRREPEGDIDDLYIAWKNAGPGGGWLTDELVDGTIPIGPRLAAGDTVIRQADVNGKTYAVLLVDDFGGSTSPHTTPILLAHEQDRWRVRWVGGGDEMSLINARRNIEFVGPFIDQLTIDGDSFTPSQDVQGNPDEVFYESNAGPHRFYTQTWEMRGEEYALVSNTVRPSPFNTTIEFIKALRRGDEMLAGSYVAAAAVVAQAMQLAIGDPTRGWNGDEIPDEWTGADVAARLRETIPDCTEPGANLRLTFTQGADGPVISGIYVADPAPAC